MTASETTAKPFFRRKGFVVFSGLALLTGLIYGLLLTYDTYFSQADGLINRYAYHNLMRLVCTVLVIAFVLYLGLGSSRKIIQNITFSLTTTVVLLLLLEVVAHVLIGAGVFGTVSMEFRRYHISSTMANQKPLFWGDFSRQTGRWRATRATHSLLTCTGDSVFRQSNSVGASDRERSRQAGNSGKKRVIILGDSFMEGSLVNYDDRVSNRLEAATNREHLNFAINGSSPINYYLVYKNIAKQFEHDVVLVGLLPANDLQDYTLSEAYTLVEWPIYRPYWHGQYPDYTLRYSLANIDQSISRNNRTPAKLLRTVDSVYRQLPVVDRVKTDLLLNSGLYKVLQKLAGRVAVTNGSMTRYEQFSETEFNYVRYSLEQVVNEAKGKKIVFVSIPILNDIEAIRNGHTNQLDRRLQQFCDQRGVLFVPLLPEFLKYRGNVAELYVPCDGHWSEKGEQFVSDVLLRNPAYQSLLN